MNFKIILSGLMALMLGLGMSGCASSVGGLAVNTIAWAGGQVADGVNSISDSIDDAQVEEEVYQNISQSSIDNNSSYNKIYQNEGLILYSKKGDNQRLYVYTKNNSSLTATSPKRIAIDMKEGNPKWFKIQKRYMPLNFSIDTFRSSLEKDKNGHALWAGSDLIIYSDYSPNSADEIFYIKGARAYTPDTNAAFTIANINDAIEYSLKPERAIRLDETIIRGSLVTSIDNNSSYKKLYSSEKLDIFTEKADDDYNELIVRDKRFPSDIVLVDTDGIDIYSKAKTEIASGGLWFPVKSCKFTIENNFDVDKVWDMLIRKDEDSSVYWLRESLVIWKATSTSMLGGVRYFTVRIIENTPPVSYKPLKAGDCDIVRKELSEKLNTDVDLYYEPLRR